MRRLRSIPIQPVYEEKEPLSYYDGAIYEHPWGGKVLYVNSPPRQGQQTENKLGHLLLGNEFTIWAVGLSGGRGRTHYAPTQAYRSESRWEGEDENRSCYLNSEAMNFIDLVSSYFEQFDKNRLQVAKP